MSKIIETTLGDLVSREKIDYVAVDDITHEEQLQRAEALMETTYVDENGVAICYDPISGDRTSLAVARIGSEVVHEPLIDNRHDANQSFELKLAQGSSPHIVLFVGYEPGEEDRTPDGFSRSAVVRSSFFADENIPVARFVSTAPKNEDGVIFHSREIPYRLTDGAEKRNSEEKQEENRVANAIGLFENIGFPSRHSRGIGRLKILRPPEMGSDDTPLEIPPGISLSVGVFLTRERPHQVPEAQALHAVFPIKVKGV